MNYYRSKFLVAFNLILLVLLGQTSILRGSNVDEEEKISRLDDDICTFYDYSIVLDTFLFRKNYKPLIVTIAREFIDGINRVSNISQSKRILDIYESVNINYLENMRKLIMENFYLYEAHNVYYFVYPVNILDNFFTIYCQKMLLSDQLGITFDFVNVKKEYPFYEDILVSLKPSCTNCPLVEYVKKKLQTGDSFSELFILREQLFREKTKYTSIKAFDNNYPCDSIGFNINSESESFIMHFNTLLQEIQKNNNSVESKKKSIFERSLKCFKSRQLFVTDEIFYDDTQASSDKQKLKHPFTGINYLNWINNTVLSVNVNDISFGNICENQHKIYIFKLFCFIKDVTDVTSYNISVWTHTLQQLVTESLVEKLKWFNGLMNLYQCEYVLENSNISFELQNWHEQISKNENFIWSSLMRTAYKLVSNLTTEKSAGMSTLSSYCMFYNYLDTIDALFPEMKFKRLVIIVANSRLTGIRKLESINSSIRVVPKIKRKDLHFTKQFVYDEIMKHFYLIQSNDTYYYVLPISSDRYHDEFMTYFKYKMIDDYSKVVFYFVNSFNYFELDKVDTIFHDSVFLALPENCHLITTNCRNRFLKPLYLINLHQEFHKRYPKYFSFYATFYNNISDFSNNHHSHYQDNNTIEYAQKFYDFLKEQPISYDTDYLIHISRCLSRQKINKRINFDFSITEIGDFLYIYSLVDHAYQNITSMNTTDNDSLKYFCMNSNIFQFIKFFCFIKINYIEGMLKLIDTKSNYVENVKEIAINEKIFIAKNLLKALNWILKMLFFSDFDAYNKDEILSQAKLSYSRIPKILSNGADSFDNLYLVVRERLLYSRCNNYLKKNSSLLNQELSSQVLEMTNNSKEIRSCLI